MHPTLQPLGQEIQETTLLVIMASSIPGKRGRRPSSLTRSLSFDNLATQLLQETTFDSVQWSTIASVAALTPALTSETLP